MTNKLKKTALATAIAAGALIGVHSQASDKPPNLLVIWGDDIGQFNISAYNMGMMGYKTPNIDSIAKQRKLFRIFISVCGFDFRCYHCILV